MPFLPITASEAQHRGWNELDVVFVTGDAYIDHPSFGVPLLARLLESHGYQVGIIAQPDWRLKEPFMTLGRPRLFFAVSSGAMDSMVAHYTPQRKLRRDDAYTQGGLHGARPNRATIVYAGRLKEAFNDVPVVLGGIEASLRRFAHYDFWDDAVRRSLLFDAKADLLIYGMGERPLLELAERLRSGDSFAAIRDIRGTAYIARNAPKSTDERKIREIPSFAEVAVDRQMYGEAFRLMAESANHFQPVTLLQQHGDRWLVCNPPALPLSTAELDAIYALPFTKAPHPSYQETIPAWEQIRASIVTHRGCFGGCSFCAIAHHQGRIVQSRSRESILAEMRELANHPWFRGSISDLGGPTANMYGAGCSSPERTARCQRASCLFPAVCPHLQTGDAEAAALLRTARNVAGVRHVAVASGVRYDLLERQPAYWLELLAHHVGGLLKVAPEHLVDRVATLMHKPGSAIFIRFLQRFREESRRHGKRQAIVPYLMAGHPGSTLADMVDVALLLRRLDLRVEQVQEFTPTPGTLATCMYYTGRDPFTGTEVYIPRSDRERKLQKSLLLWHLAAEQGRVREALRLSGREDAAAFLCAGSGRPTSHHDSRC